MITIATIGFGDVVPKTFLGMVVGSFCALMVVPQELWTGTLCLV